MTDPTPITGEELEAMKDRCLNAPLGMGCPLTIVHGKEDEELVFVLKPSEAEKLRQCMSDLPRCLTEIERLQAENYSLRNEAARIILLAEEHPDPDSLTFTLKFTKELLAELRSLLA